MLNQGIEQKTRERERERESNECEYRCSRFRDATYCSFFLNVSKVSASKASVSKSCVFNSVHFYVYNSREKNRNAKCIVDMESSTTLLFNPNNVHEPPKKFTFDYSYWSHDGFIESSDGFCERDPNHPNGNKYADQVCDSQIVNLLNNGDLLKLI